MMDGKPTGLTRCSWPSCPRYAHLSTSDRCWQCRDRGEPTARNDGSQQAAQLVTDGGQPTADVPTADEPATPVSDPVAGEPANSAEIRDRILDRVAEAAFWSLAPLDQYDEITDVQYVTVTRPSANGTVHLPRLLPDGTVADTPRCTDYAQSAGRSDRGNKDDYTTRTAPRQFYDSSLLCDVCVSAALCGDSRLVARGPAGGGSRVE